MQTIKHQDEQRLNLVTGSERQQEKQAVNMIEITTLLENQERL